MTDETHLPFKEATPKKLATGGYLLEWGGEYNVLAYVSRIKAVDGQVKGELQIAYSANGTEKTALVPTYYNFSSETSRSRHAKDIAAKVDLPIYWDLIFDDLCHQIIVYSRMGEDVIDIETADADAPPPEYLIHPLIVKHYPNVFFGDPSACKSTLALILAQVAILPWTDNPMRLKAPSKAVKVLYLDWEADQDTIRWQTTQIQRGTERIALMGLRYRHCSQPLANDVEEIRRAIVKAEADLIIVDSLGLAAGGELKDTQSALGFYGALRCLKVTSLILAHNSKDRETKQRSIYGNQYFTAQARNVWEVRKVQEPGSSEANIALYHRKPPPFAGTHAELGFKIIFNDQAGSMTIAPRDPKSVGEFLENMSLSTRIQEALKEGCMDTSALAEILDAPIPQVKARCHDLKRRELVTKLSDGNWGLVRRVP